jgi:prepilin-type N-terminal cleavage/methylation domain-containing protein
MKTIKGFTIPELMIVVTIIGMMFAIAVPSYMSYKEKQVTSKRGRRGRPRKKKRVAETHRNEKPHVEQATTFYDANKSSTPSIAAYQAETERLRKLNALPKQIEARNREQEQTSDERDCIYELKRLGYKITRQETVDITEKQIVVKEY